MNITSLVVVTSWLLSLLPRRDALLWVRGLLRVPRTSRGVLWVPRTTTSLLRVPTTPALLHLVLRRVRVLNQRHRRRRRAARRATWRRDSSTGRRWLWRPDVLGRHAAAWLRRRRWRCTSSFGVLLRDRSQLQGQCLRCP